MADPFTLGTAAVGTGLSVLGGFAQAKGASQKAEAESQMYQMKAAIARKNAQISRQNALWTTEATEQNALRRGIQTSFTLGKQKVGQAASGFDVNTGTAAEVRESTAKVGQMDTDLLRTEGRRKAIGYGQAADMSELEAQLDEQAAANAKKAGEISVFSTLIGTAGSVADKWSKASSAFGKGSSGITTYGSNFEVTGFYA